MTKTTPFVSFSDTFVTFSGNPGNKGGEMSITRVTEFLPT